MPRFAGSGRVYIRVLIAFEDEYRVYGAAITGAIRRARLTDEVVTTEIGELEREVRRFDPHLIISSLPALADSGRWVSWMRLSSDPTRLSEICVEGNRWELSNPSLGEVLSVLEETEGLLVGSNQRPRREL